MKRILLIDDQLEDLRPISRRLEKEGFAVAGHANYHTAVEIVKAFEPQLVFLDLEFGSVKDAGIKALQELRRLWPKEKLPVIMLSGRGDGRTLSRAIQAGANTYFIKPIDDLDDFIEKIKVILGPGIEDQYARCKPPETETVLGGESEIIMKKNLEIIKSAQAEIDTIFTGETGTGKEVAARMYHQHSRRKNKSLITVNCPGIPSELFESEVFGYKKGAFGNAVCDKPGLVEQAEGGIVFFDEIGYMALQHQTKLLRFIQFKTSMRLGSTEEKKLDVIILAATSKDLLAMVEKGEFLSELYFRLNTNLIIIPPLRQRKSDIPYLAQYFFEKYKTAAIRQMDTTVVAEFCEKDWPGNVRELENCILNGIHRCEGQVLTLKDFAGQFIEAGPEVPAPLAGNSALLQRMDYEAFKAYDEEAQARLRISFYVLHLEENHWNISRTAEKLGMKKEFLRQLMKKYGIQQPTEDA
ncbi:sigma-54-dependent Fis family transcriptional regulator [candidate division FCPU426 bacterium]|nr:sigma-54-dependent Fis family transcriptional regulator [candidate division FCPU426 bacterium]